VIVLDSSFLIGFHNPSDAHHAAARVLMERFLAGEWGKGCCSKYVFLEVVTVIMLRPRSGSRQPYRPGFCWKPKNWNSRPARISSSKR